MKVEIIKISSKSDATLTCYIHDKSEELSNADKRPGLLVFPGGGYFMCSDREAEPIALAYLAEGYNVFILRYTVGNETTYNKVIYDAERAMETLTYNKEKWNLDIKKIAVIGFSAGGHLAAMFTSTTKRKPNALILGYPVINLKNNVAFSMPFQVPDATEFVTKDNPPTFMYAMCDDPLVPEDTLYFALALHKAGVPYELHVFQNNNHGLSLAKPLTSNGMKSTVDERTAKWFSMSISWLNKNLGDFPLNKTYAFEDTVTDFDVYSVDVQLRVLLKNPDCKKLIFDKVPSLASTQETDIVMDISLRTIKDYISDDILNDAILEELDQQLKEIDVI